MWSSPVLAISRIEGENRRPISENGQYQSDSCHQPSPERILRNRSYGPPVAAIDAPRVLVVEDDKSIREAVLGSLRQGGCVTVGLVDGGRFEKTLGEFRPDLIVLDVMLPQRDGFELARALRSVRDVPFLFLTARDGVGSRLAGFALGADDYVVKPFHTEELLARVRALLRRSGRLRSDVIEVGDLIVDESRREARRGGRTLELTETEFRLLSYLALNRGRALSRIQILTQVWGFDYDQHLVTVYVSSLRRKLEELGPRLIHTVRGRGYVLRSP
jgi:DNA-binding response OmpR family regulator